MSSPSSTSVMNSRPLTRLAIRSASTRSESFSFTAAELGIHLMSNSGVDLSAEQQWIVPRPNSR